MNIPPIPPPSRDDIARIGESYRLRLSAADAESFRALVAGNLASHHAVERLYAERIAETPVRAWQWPAADANPLGGWYVTAGISTGKPGPLSGRRVAVKDNIAVAGVPMMNGSATVEGYIPQRDATVVTRLLAAGATIAGKAVCEDLCFSGGSHMAPQLAKWRRHELRQLHPFVGRPRRFLACSRPAASPRLLRRIANWVAGLT